jgi:RNA polymerase sigma-70 factor, ECF subfamily
MSVGGHAQRGYGRYAGHPGHGGRAAGEAHALAAVPDSDIVRALRDLPADLRLAVYLADVEGYCYREIAEITGTPVGTVASRLHHGRDRLRDRLARAAVQRGLPATPG